MGEPEAVEVSKVIAATPATLWRCITQSSLLSRWLSAEARIDPRPGGSVRIHFAAHATRVEGVIETFEPGRCLAFTWGVSEGAQIAELPVGSTRVSITLTPLGDGSTTRVTLRHSGLPTEKQRHDHVGGWTAYLTSLDSVVWVAAVEGGIDSLWDAWFNAWGETDGNTRTALLNRCASSDCAFLDVHASGSGQTWLDGWIVACQGMFPGFRMARSGAAMQVRDRLLVRWEAFIGDVVIARGFNHGRLDAEGRLLEVEGFRDVSGSASSD